MPEVGRFHASASAKFILQQFRMEMQLVFVIKWLQGWTEHTRLKTIPFSEVDGRTVREILPDGFQIVHSDL